MEFAEPETTYITAAVEVETITVTEASAPSAT
jgi:hypothetical protein